MSTEFLPVFSRADTSRLKSWSRHQSQTPTSKESWSTSYRSTYNGKKINFNPDHTIIDYFSGTSYPATGRQSTQSRQSRQGDNLRSGPNARAREGFRYWMIDKPRPTYTLYKKNWKIWNWFV